MDELILLLSSIVFAARPDNGGGLFSFDDSDVLAYVDGPMGAVPGRQAISQYWTLLRTLALMFQFVEPLTSAEAEATTQ